MTAEIIGTEPAEERYNFQPLDVLQEEIKWARIYELTKPLGKELIFPKSWLRSDKQDKLRSFVTREAAKRTSGQKYSSLLERYERILEVVLRLRNDSNQGKLKAEILKDMEKGSYGSAKKLFKEDEVKEVSSNGEGFEDLFERGVSRSPVDQLFRKDKLRRTELILGREKTRELLDAAAKAEGFLFVANFGEVSRFYSPGEAKSLVEEFAETNPMAVFLYFGKPEVCNLFAPEEARRILLTAEKLSYNNAFSADSLSVYVQRGYLNRNDLREIFIRRIREDVNKSHGDSIVKELPEFLVHMNAVDKVEIAKEVREAFDKESSNLRITDLKEVDDGIMSLDEKKQRVKLAIEEDLSVVDYFREDDPIIGKKDYKIYYNRWVEDLLDKEDYYHFFPSYTLRALLSQEIISEPNKKRIVAEASTNAPEMFIDCLDIYLAQFPPESRPRAVKKALARCSVSEAFLEIKSWIDYVPDKERKTFLTAMVRSENDFTFLRAFFDGRAILANYFSKEEIRDFFKEQVDLGIEKFFSRDVEGRLDRAKKLLGGDDALKEFIEENRKRSFSNFIISLKYVNYLYETSELESIFLRESKIKENGIDCIDYIEYWPRYISYEAAGYVIDGLKENHAFRLLYYLRKCLVYIPKNKVESFIRVLIQYNPAAALDNAEEIRIFIPELTPENIQNSAVNDSKRFSLAPRSLGETFKLAAKEQDPFRKTMILQRGAWTYQQIAEIRAAGLEEKYKEIQTAEQMTTREENDLILIFHCFAMLTEKGSLGSENLGSSIREAKEILFKKLSDRFGLDSEPDQSNIDNFIATMASPVPFLIYYLQYEDLPEHQAILREIFESLLNNTFGQWKFGEDTEEELERLKEKGQLPRNLTLEQYRRWRENEKTSLHESLASSAEVIAEEIRGVLLQNNESHLRAEALYDIKAVEEISQKLIEVQEGLRLVGKELGPTSKEIGILKKRRNKERLSALEQEELKRLEGLERGLNSQKVLLVKNLNLLKLALLTPEEITTGYLLKNNDVAKKGASIERAIKTASAMVPTEAGFVFRRLEELLANFKSQGVDRQNLTCSDTSDPRITLEIGESPSPSCQNYHSGEHNDCLLGYFVPDTKILTLTNEKSNLIARSIFRLLEDENGDTQLYAEVIYSSSASPAVQKTILTHALEKAQSMGVKLFVSPEFKEEGFKFTRSKEILISNGSKAPKVYVDSAGGEQSWGRYKIKELVLVEDLEV